MPEVGFNVSEAEGSKMYSTITKMYSDIARPLFQSDPNKKKPLPLPPLPTEKKDEKPSLPLENEKPTIIETKEKKSFIDKIKEITEPKENINYFDDIDPPTEEVYNIEVWKDGKIALDNDPSNEFNNTLDSVTLDQLEKAINSPVGTEVKGLENITIVDREINSDKVSELFKVDENGVITNNAKSPEQERRIIDGSNRAKELLQKAGANNPEVKALTEKINELQEQIRLQEEFINRQLQVNKSQNKTNQELSKRLEENERMKQARLSKPNDTNWWQKGINKFKGLKETYQQRREEQKTIKTLNKLWDKNTDKDSKVYQTRDYTLEKNNYDMILKDKDDNILLAYDSRGNFIFQNDLKPDDVSNIKELQNRLSKRGNENNLGQFSSIDNQNKLRNQQSQEVADNLIKMARESKSGKISKDGSVYQINAKANGSVKIWKKGDIPELIYNQSEKGQLNKMTDDDIKILKNAFDKEKNENAIPKNSMTQQFNKAVERVTQTIAKRGGR